MINWFKFDALETKIGDDSLRFKMITDDFEVVLLQVLITRELKNVNKTA